MTVTAQYHAPAHLTGAPNICLGLCVFDALEEERHFGHIPHDRNRLGHIAGIEAVTRAPAHAPSLATSCVFFGISAGLVHGDTAERLTAGVAACLIVLIVWLLWRFALSRQALREDTEGHWHSPSPLPSPNSMN